jgi:pimeloyl-ACP methyl ester carboxylesterase
MVSTVVVYVHGLWLNGLEGILLRRRLARKLKAETRSFSYASVTAKVSDNARVLARYLRTIRSDHLHLVGHSLGGVVILKLFELGEDADLPPGRIVLLGSPLNGSQTARNLARLPLGKMIVGSGAQEELLAIHERRWQGGRQLGVIAGNLSIGLGRLVGAHRSPSDGTVFVEETRLAGSVGHLVLRVSHTGLPFSATVARQAGEFLATGQFSR